MQWARKGLSTLCLLVENQEFIDFKTISERYGLAWQDFYRYLQLRHYFDKNIKGLIQENISGITKMFIKAYNTKLSRQIIGELYRHIVELRGHSTNYIKAKWEKELGTVTTSEDWTNIINTQITTIASQLWRDFSWKNCIRFFITPMQKSRQTRLQLTCRRGCGHSMADHMHIFWSCPTLKSFWEEVRNIISEVLQYKFNFTCLSFYLLLTITRRWLNTESPTVNQWEAIIKDIQTMELLTFRLRLQRDKGEALWEKWSTYSTRRGDNLS